MLPQDSTRDFWPYWGSGSRIQFTLIALVFSTRGVSYGASCEVPFLGGVLVKGWIDINKYGFLLRICKSITDLPGEEINSPHRGSYCSLLFLPATPLKRSQTPFAALQSRTVPFNTFQPQLVCCFMNYIYNTVRQTMLGIEVLGHCWINFNPTLTQTLIVWFY